MERLFGLPDIKLCTFFTALDCINNIVPFVFGSFVLRVNQFLSQSGAGSEGNSEVKLGEISSEFL